MYSKYVSLVRDVAAYIKTLSAVAGSIIAQILRLAINRFSINNHGKLFTPICAPDSKVWLPKIRWWWMCHLPWIACDQISTGMRPRLLLRVSRWLVHDQNGMPDVCTAVYRIPSSSHWLTEAKCKAQTSVSTRSSCCTWICQYRTYHQIGRTYRIYQTYR